MEDVIGTVRREDHEHGYNLWLLMLDLGGSEPVWRCVYSTTPGDVGYPWLDGVNQRPIGSDTEIVGCLPGTQGSLTRRITHPNGAHAMAFDIPGWPCPSRVRDIPKNPNSWGYALINDHDVTSAWNMVARDELGYLWADGQATPRFKIPDGSKNNPGGVLLWTEKGLGLWIHPKTRRYLGEVSRLDMEPERWVPVAVVVRDLPEFVTTEDR